MIQKTGPATFIDHGPASAVHSRGRVPGGVMVSQAPAPVLSQTNAYKRAWQRKHRAKAKT